MEYLNDRNNRKKLLYCIFFVAAQILLYLAIKIYRGDDVNSYIKVWNNYGSLSNFLISRYQRWSSRIVIDALTVYFVQNVFLWKVTSIAVSGILAYSLYELSDKESLFGVFAIILLYPLKDMSSAGWIATMLNYYWPLSFGFYSLVVIHKLVREREICWGEILLSFGALLIGISSEQYCAVHLALLVIYTAYAICNRCINKSFWIIIGHYFITAANLLFIVTCPGNYVRKASEVRSWMRNYYEKTLMDQLIDGFETTFSVLLSSNNIIFLIFAAMVFICVWKKREEFLYRLIAGIPLTGIIIISFRNIDANGFFSSIASRITSNTGVTATNWHLIGNYLPLVLYVTVAVCIVASFFILFDELGKCLECAFLFIVAIVSRVIMGVSPTLFASGNRTFMFCYGLIMLMMLRIYAYEKEGFSEREIKAGKYTAIFLCVYVVMNSVVAAG